MAQMQKLNTNFKKDLHNVKVGRKSHTKSIDACTSSIQLRKYRNELLKEWLKSANFSLQILL
jgi:hypothetical protein